ncbi:uncharacterized protein LOC114315447 [Camellia sinensis]|uniref:uncharacterized protein LOC114315447 n=1 Tax=Camellia sinensis TaxID=4442 RepID=UPI0010365D92|nr:uncharacterized protein LOC114315447 [Camellia sinensis]
MERLDRALCNTEWRTMFSEATVRVLPRTYSDHSPLIVYTQCMHNLNPLNRPFRFEAAWMTHLGLIDVIKYSWTDMNHNLIDSTVDFTCKVKEWKKEEEILWFQKSKSKHILLGVRNTKYFHVSTITKRRKIKINALKDNFGNWTIDSIGIKATILEYFQNLFSGNLITQLDHWKNISPFHFTQEDNDGLAKPISNSEILRAVKDIGAFKAPGRDDIQATFYHNY